MVQGKDDEKMTRKTNKTMNGWCKEWTGSGKLGIIIILLLLYGRSRSSARHGGSADALNTAFKKTFPNQKLHLFGLDCQKRT